MATPLIDSYNKAKQSDPNLTLANFQKTFDYSAAAPTQSAPTQPTPTGGTPLAPFSRDQSKEQQTLSKLGISGIQAMQLQNNPVFQKNFLEMTYGSDASKLAEYQKLTQADQQREQLGGQMEQIRQNAPNAMLALEDALRTKVDVGNQELGKSELFNKAGLDGFFNLNQSLAENSKMMQERYGSFVNALSRVGQYQQNQYRGLSQQYQAKTAEYQMQVEQMNKTLDEVQRYNEGMKLAEKELQMKKDYALWERELEAGKYDPDIQDYNRGAYESGDIRSTQTTNIQGMQIIDQRDPNGDNCVLFQRAEGIQMPYGLFTIEDKRKAVQMSGRTDMENIQIGDAILTSEGSVGHAARVIDIRDGKLILREANYKPGMVTEGREIDMNDRAILGYFAQKPSELSENSNSWAQLDQFMLKNQGAVNPDAVDKEGYNVSIEEQTLGEGGAGSFDQNSQEYQLASSILDPFSDATLKDLTPTQKAKVLPILNELKQQILAENPGATGIMLTSAGGAKPSDSFIQSMEKAGTVVNQLGNLNTALGKSSIIDQSERQEGKLDLAPLSGWLAKKNPWNTNAAEVSAILQATVPNLARGIYGEVGVLTDADIQNYIKTLPNLQSTDQIKKLVMSATLKVVKNSIENKITYNANSGNDMSRWVPSYNTLMQEIENIDSSIGLGGESGGVDNEFLSIYNSN